MAAIQSTNPVRVRAASIDTTLSGWLQEWDIGEGGWATGHCSVTTSHASVSDIRWPLLPSPLLLNAGLFRRWLIYVQLCMQRVSQQLSQQLSRGLHRNGITGK